ncbi:hypothetical protein D9619_004957 [Psilocybe cf. subviscida]|uniref:Uncharacterized protein n=1 Tax=Psilocybe cf. subviscida TaxID=2480587 RepID=A0A8H5F815_9AGAR|nr:hypothetical protein D9619_004957 [Psilocybe cf. subviscida]
MAQPAVRFIALFDALYIAGLVSLIAIVLTAWLSPTIRRSSTWFMFIWSWLLLSIANIIIVGQQTGPEPMTGICLFQAMLIYGLPVLSSFYAVAFTLQVYVNIQGAIQGRPGVSRNQLIAIHALPIVSCVGVFIEVLVLGLSRPDAITRDDTGMFCHLASSFPSRLTAGITIFAMVVFMVLGFRLYRIIRRRQEALIEISGPGAKGYLSRDVVTRVLVFSCCPIIALTVSSLQYLSSSHLKDTTSNIILAGLPLVASFIFGTQKDILRVWTSFIPHREMDPGDREIKPATA